VAGESVYQGKDHDKCSVNWVLFRLNTDTSA